MTEQEFEQLSSRIQQMSYNDAVAEIDRHAKKGIHIAYHVMPPIGGSEFVVPVSVEFAIHAYAITPSAYKHLQERAMTDMISVEFSFTNAIVPGTFDTVDNVSAYIRSPGPLDILTAELRARDCYVEPLDH